VTASKNDDDRHFQRGNCCFLVLMGQRFLVGILNVGEEAVRVSFPMSDFPLPGMFVELEFHDEAGYTSYESEVLEIAEEVGDGLLLRLPPEPMRNNHRGSWRVPGGFKAVLKGHVHPRAVEVEVRNVSSGGMLVYGKVDDLNIDDNLDITLALPGMERERLVGDAVHVQESAEDGGSHIGIKFVSPDPTLISMMMARVWQRVREKSPHGLTHLRRGSDARDLGLTDRRMQQRD